MNRIIILSFAIVTALATASASFAGERRGAFSVSPFIGGYTFDGTQHLETGPVYGLRLGYDFTRNCAAEGVFAYVDTERSNAIEEMETFSYRLDLLYNFMPYNVLVPYLAVGGGETDIVNSLDHRDSNATFNFGGGLKYFFTDSIALRGDLRHLLVFGLHTINNWEYSLGVSFLFGGKEEAAPAEPAPVPEPAPAPPPPPAVEEKPLPPSPAAEPMPETTKYCITLDIMFDIDKADIRRDDHDKVGRVGTFMQKFPTTTAVIEGHADEVGTDEHNMELSQRRAESVVNYLADNFGIDRSRLTAKGYGKTRPVADNSSEERKQKNRRIEAIIDCAVDIKGLTPVPDRLCLTLKTEFDTDSAVIKPQYHDEIAKVADFMKENPTVTAVVEGHTDNVGKPDYNLKLSQRRAESVVNYLAENFGIDRSRLSAKGYGDTRRIAYNSTPEGRQKNRRINVILDCVLKK